LKEGLNMGWRDFQPDPKKETSGTSGTFGLGVNTFGNLGILVNKSFLDNNNNYINDSTHYPPDQKPRKYQKGQEPELKTVWTNPFPLGSREAREESRRIVEEAVADSEKNPGTIRAQGFGEAHRY
jgi:hypothetical protein